MEGLLAVLDGQLTGRDMADLASSIELRINPRARRISLRVDQARRKIVLVRPRRCSETLVLKFLAEKRSWVEQQLASMPACDSFADGTLIALLGEAVTLRASATHRRGVWREGDNIFVSGAPEHFARRVRDWLKAEAQRQYAVWAREYAERLEVRVARVSVRDTRSRWGSCTRDGRLSLSWRLILAPHDVARYVVAHEVAHLRHMNHSPAFWRTVESLAGPIKAHRQWLHRHGGQLHRYT
jgi:predicted metal-dependent hydrolase